MRLRDKDSKRKLLIVRDIELQVERGGNRREDTRNTEMVTLMMYGDSVLGQKVGELAHVFQDGDSTSAV